MLDNDPRVPIIPAMLVLTAATGGATTGPTSTKAQRHDYNAALLHAGQQPSWPVPRKGLRP
jgi:hypothetical protein